MTLKIKREMTLKIRRVEKGKKKLNNNNNNNNNNNKK